MTNYVATLAHLVDGAKFSYGGVEPAYEAIEWQDERDQPTQEECDAAWPALEKQMANDAAKAARARAYQNEADPLFFGFQRGENAEKAWTDKVAEIRARFPYVES